MQDTRQAILNILKRRGPITIEELRDDLDLTPATIRHHLDILRSEQLVEATALKRRPTPGRPQYIYALTAQANEHFPQRYAEFSDLTLREINERAGPGELEAVMRGVAHRMLNGTPRPAPGEPLNQRLDRVVEFLSRKGYLARWEQTDAGYLLHTANCPYQALVHQHQAPCVMDMTLMTELLGQAPQRIVTLSAGSPTCTYLVAQPD